jgi:hypothetical protein
MQQSRETETTETRLALARRRADDLQPFSPAWDAAMSWVEDLERERVTRATTPTEADES